MHKGPLPLTEVAHEIVSQQLLHLVGGVQDERVLQKGKLLFSCEGIIVSEETVIERHIDAAVELLVQELFPRDNRSDDVVRVDL